MKFKHLLSAIFCVALVALFVVADKQDEKDKEARDKIVDGLIKQLGDESFDKREKAHKALDDMGAGALDALRKAMDSPDAEIKKRAKMLVEKIDQRVTQTRLLAAKEVQLVFKDTPISEAVADIAKKTGYTIKLHDPESKLKDKKITLDTGKTTFWDAIAKFCEKAGLADGDPNQGGLGVNFIAPPPIVQPGGGGGLQPLPLPVPVPIKPVEKQLDKPAERKDEKKQEKQNDSNAAQQEKPLPKPAQGQVDPVALPAAGGPALGGPAQLPAAAWVNVKQGEIYLMPVKDAKKAADTRSSIRVRLTQKGLNVIPLDKEHIAAALELTIEPRLRWHQVGKVKVEKAKDDQDQNLEPIEVKGGEGNGAALFPLPGGPAVMPAMGMLGVWNPNGLSQTAPLKFKKALKETKSFKELTGTVTCSLLDDTEDCVTVENVMKMEGKSAKGKKGGEITINKIVKEKDGQVKIEFTLEQPEKVQPVQVDIPMPADLMLQPAGPVVPIKPLQIDPKVAPKKDGQNNQANATEDKPDEKKTDEKKTAEKKADEKQAVRPAIQVAQIPVQVQAGGGGVAAIALPAFFANNTGVTLRDEKGKAIFAQVHIDFNKMRNGGFNPNQKKVEYVAVYKPGKDMPATPSQLVFSARRLVEVIVPFSLKDAELK